MLHPTHFSTDCYPLPVETHVHRMQQMSTWGTHAEIRAMALCFNLPVYVAVQKDPDADTCSNYHWAKFSRGDSELHRVSAIPAIDSIKHMEVININNMHHNVVVNSDSSFSSMPPVMN